MYAWRVPLKGIFWANGFKKGAKGKNPACNGEVIGKLLNNLTTDFIKQNPDGINTIGVYFFNDTAMFSISKNTSPPFAHPFARHRLHPAHRPMSNLGITMMDGRLPDLCQGEVLLELPLVLLVREKSRFRSAEELLRQRPVAAELVCPRADDIFARAFRQGLARRGAQWETMFEVNSIELGEALVRGGFGVGLSARVPGRPRPAGLRMLPLRGFPSVQVGMIWRSGVKPDAVTAALMEEVRRMAGRMRRGVSTEKIPT